MAVLLIIEDGTVTNEAVCEYMKSIGHETLSAFDGEQGLKLARCSTVGFSGYTAFDKTGRIVLTISPGVVG